MQPSYASDLQARLQRILIIKLNLESTLYRPSLLLYTNLTDCYIRE